MKLRLKLNFCFTVILNKRNNMIKKIKVKEFLNSNKINEE